MEKQNIQFGPDKSQILRGIAIVFMILLHNDCGGLFKICVPIFTFLVGYGYAFSKQKNLKHAAKRSWHLLSHFWLILLGIFLPIAIWTGGYKPVLDDVVKNLFGVKSNLNWYSWYVYFYIYAMVVMIPVSRIIARFKIWGTLVLSMISIAGYLMIHFMPDWNKNIYTNVSLVCLIMSSPMFVGFYLAEGGVVTNLRLPTHIMTAIISLIIMVGLFFARSLPFAYLVDWILTPIFCVATVILFNVIKGWLPNLLIKLGKQSMNMWFLHSLFFTACTATVCAPLLFWIHPKGILITVMILFSYYASILVNKIYNTLTQGN